MRLRKQHHARKIPEPPVQPAPPPPLGEEEAEVKKPSLLKRVLKRVGFAVLLAAALVFAYVFLLLGEPDEDAKYAAEQKEAVITAPMSALEVPGSANVQTMAQSFGVPVLSMGQALEMKKARIPDVSFDGGYARRVTLTYTFEDGTELTAESIRPTAAVTLLNQQGYQLDASALYTLGGLNAGRMDNAVTCCVFAQSGEAVYAVVCPQTHAEEMTGLLRYTMLVAPDAGE